MQIRIPDCAQKESRTPYDAPWKSALVFGGILLACVTAAQIGLLLSSRLGERSLVGAVVGIISLIGFALLVRYCSRKIQHAYQTSFAAATLISIVESSNDAIMGKNLRGIITSWNRGAERMYGYTAEEAIGKPISILLPKGYEDEIKDILARMARGECVRHYETKRLTKAGDIVEVSLTVSPIKNSAGQLIGASAIARDITAEKRADEALRLALDKYRLLFDSSPLPMWVFDRNTLAFLAVNEAAIRHYGYSRQEFFRMTVIDIRPEEEVERLLKRVSQPGRGLQEVETWRHRKKDGSIIDVEITAHDIEFEGRDAELILAHDITQRKRAEERLLHSEEKFSKVFRSSPFGITITTELEARYIDANPAFLNMLGYGREDVIGRSATELNIWADPEKRDHWLQQLNGSQELQLIEVRFRARSGDLRLAQIAGQRIQFENTNCILSIIQDVTETKRLEKQFLQAQKMEAIGQLTAGIAHDFNNLLNVIIGYSELSKDHVEGKVRSHLDHIKTAGQRAAVLIRQLLAFSRQQVLQPRVLNLNQVVNNISMILRRVIGEDIGLVFRQAEPLNSVNVDPGQMEQVLMNLAVNARDAMPEGGKIFIETANVDLDENYARLRRPIKPGRYVLLSVSDSGVGMDPATLSRIFEPFFTTKSSTGGTGLGLSTVYGIVQQSGGQILAYSELFVGTTFKIYLPIVEQPAEALVPSKAQDAFPAGTETILLVEDDEPVRSLIVSLLQERGYTVLEADNAAAAITITQQHQGKIDLLLSDVIMPGMSGPDMAIEMRAYRRDFKIVYMSGYAGDVIAHQGVLDPAVTLLPKPFTRASLLNLVRVALEK